MLNPRNLAVGQANIAAKEPGSSLRSICPAPTDGCQAPEEQISWLGGSHVCSLQLVIHIIHHNPTSQMDYDGLWINLHNIKSIIHNNPQISINLLNIGQIAMEK